MSSFRISNLLYVDNQLFVEWEHLFQEVETFCIILDQDGSCEFRTTIEQESVYLSNIEPGEYLVKVQALADGVLQETPGKFITVE